MSRVLDLSVTMNDQEPRSDSDRAFTEEDRERTYGSRALHSHAAAPAKHEPPAAAHPNGRQASQVLALASRSIWRFIGLLGVVLSPSGLSRTFGGNSAEAGNDEEGRWFVKNERRSFLITKKYKGGGLNPAETAELDRLQAEMSQYVNAVAPLPMQALESLEEYARQLEQQTNQPGA